MVILDVLKELAIKDYLFDCQTNGWKDFHMNYQPIVSFKNHSMRLVSAEALVRCKGEVLGEPIFPDQFIPLIEKEPKMSANFGEYVMSKVIDDSKKHNFLFPVSINVSSSQLNEVSEFDEALKKYETDFLKGKFKIEITESQKLRIEAVKYLESIYEKGYSIWCDDICTGQNTLTELIQRKFYSGIKVDRSFIADANFITNNWEAKISKGIINIGLNLDLDVIIEGVETIEQARYLGDNYDVLLQGFYFSKGVSPEEIARFKF